jgi:hypothetical protein
MTQIGLHHGYFCHSILAEKSKTLFVINHEAQVAAIDPFDCAQGRLSIAIPSVPAKLSNHQGTEAFKEGPAAAGVNRRYRTT